MKLNEIDWSTLTREQARRLRPAATRAERSAADKFNRDEITEDEFRAALMLEEDLLVFAITGQNPRK